MQMVDTESGQRDYWGCARGFGVCTYAPTSVYIDIYIYIYVEAPTVALIPTLRVGAALLHEKRFFVVHGHLRGVGNFI